MWQLAMCVAVRLAAGWWTTAVARVEQREREGKRGRKREKERENHRQIKSKGKIECAKESVCERERDGEEEAREHSNRQPTVTEAAGAAF